MDLPDLGQLGKVIELCRKKGVKSIQLGEGSGCVKLELGEEPKGRTRKEKLARDPEDKFSDFPPGELTPEQLMYYSAGGTPDNDPFLKANKEGEQ